MDETDPARESLRHWRVAAPAWEHHRARLFENARSVSEWLVDHVDARPGRTVLELTAGPGETGFLAAPRLAPGGLLVSTDFVPAMVDAARRGAAERGLDNVECRVIDATRIDMPDASVDGVLSRFGLMLVPAQDQAMLEIHRVLRPGGRCAFATWGPPDRNPWIFQIVLALLENGWTPPGDPFEPGGVFSLATPERTRELAGTGSLTDVTVEELDGVMRFDSVDDYWATNVAVAGPVAEYVATLDDDQVRSVRATLDPSVAPFARGGGLEVPWVSVVTAGTRAG